jgi:hypothetical protein
MKEALFKNTALQEAFDCDGYVKLRMFSAETIGKLQTLLKHYGEEDPKAFFSSSYLEDFALKKEISDRVVDCIQEEVAAACENFRLIGAAFLIKGSGERSEMPMHQDWTIVDEEAYYACNIWIPLVSTNEENGTLELLKGSHRWNKALRAPTLPMAFAGFEEMIKPKLTVVNAEPGEVVVLNQATIHYSKPNKTRAIRPAITSGLISAKAPLLFNYWDTERQQIEQFAEEDDFLLRFENFHDAIYKRPQMGESLGFIDYEIVRFDEAEMRQRLGIQTAKPKGFFHRLFHRA